MTHAEFMQAQEARFDANDPTMTHCERAWIEEQRAAREGTLLELLDRRDHEAAQAAADADIMAGQALDAEFESTI